MLTQDLSVLSGTEVTRVIRIDLGDSDPRSLGLEVDSIVPIHSHVTS